MSVVMDGNNVRIVDNNVKQPASELLYLSLARVDALLGRDVQLRNAQALLGEGLEDFWVARSGDDMAALLLELEG
jgi:hypothetical protein